MTIHESEFEFIGFWTIITPDGRIFGCDRFDFEDDYKNTLEQAIKDFGQGTIVLSQSEFEKWKKEKRKG